MGTIGIDGKMVLETYCCKTDIFGSVSRGNRFPSGRTRVPVCKIEKLGIFELSNRFPTWRNRVPHTIFQGRWNLEFWEPVTPREEPGSTVLFWKIFKTSKIHNFQTVRPFWAPFWTLFLKFNALIYKMKRFPKTWNYFENESNPEISDYWLTHIGVYVAVNLWWWMC